MSLLSEFGGTYSIVWLIFNTILQPLALHSFFFKVLNKLYFVKTKSNELFINSKQFSSSKVIQQGENNEEFKDHKSINFKFKH